MFSDTKNVLTLMVLVNPAEEDGSYTPKDYDEVPIWSNSIVKMDKPITVNVWNFDRPVKIQFNGYRHKETGQVMFSAAALEDKFID